MNKSLINTSKKSLPRAQPRGTFELYDIIGKKLYSTSLSESATELDLNSFNNGTYLYKIVQDGKTIKQDRIIISK